MSWDRLVQIVKEDSLVRIIREALKGNLKEIKTVSWVKAPVLLLLLVDFMPLIGLLAKAVFSSRVNARHALCLMKKRSAKRYEIGRGQIAMRVVTHLGAAR